MMSFLRKMSGPEKCPWIPFSVEESPRTAQPPLCLAPVLLCEGVQSSRKTSLFGLCATDLPDLGTRKARCVCTSTDVKLGITVMM